MRVKDVTQLEVFKIAHELALDIYKVTSKFPKEELYNLVSQLRKASSSICANLMEGSYRNSSKEFKQFCGIARGSAGELKYFLMLSKDLGYIENKKAEELINKTNQITKMLYRLIKSLERKNAKK